MLDTHTRIYLPQTMTTDYRRDYNPMQEHHRSNTSRSCPCCHDPHREEHRHLADVPKLLRLESSFSPVHSSMKRHDSMDGSRSPSDFINDSHRRVSVIKTSPTDHFMTESSSHLRRKTSSVSSIDQQSEVSYHSEKSFDTLSRASLSPPICHEPRISNDQLRTDRYEDYYRALSLSSPPLKRRQEVRREKLTVLHNENERTHIEPGVFNYRDIPSPSYQQHPMSLHFHPRHPHHPHHQHSPAEKRNFVFTPYLDQNLRQKFSELSDFSIKKRYRTIFTPSQLRKLEEKFNECNFIVGVDRSALAKQLKLKEHQVKIWFQNRRTKVKQLTKETPSNTDVDIMS